MQTLPYLYSSFRSRSHYAGGISNGGFTLKTHQMFSVHTTTEKLEKTTVTGHFKFTFEENSVREISHIVTPSFSPFSKRFQSALKRKVSVFKRVPENVRFHDGLVWTVGLA